MKEEIVDELAVLVLSGTADDELIEAPVVRSFASESVVAADDDSVVIVIGAEVVDIDVSLEDGDEIKFSVVEETDCSVVLLLVPSAASVDSEMTSVVIDSISAVV